MSHTGAIREQQLKQVRGSESK